MYQAALFIVFALTVGHSYGFTQVQMPEAAEFLQPDEDLQAQVKELQKNVTDLWNYIFKLRNAVSHHLTHLRKHQVDLETSMHRMEHFHESDLQSSGHHHSGEQHSHSGEHSHGTHSSEHSHGGEHSHGPMESHSHSGEQHSHSGEYHSHNGDHGHYSHSYSHSHTSHDHSKEDSHNHDSHDDHSQSHGSHDDHSHSHGSHDDHSHSHDSHDDSHSHGHDHKDSHETEDLTQQTQKVGDPASEPIVTSTNRQEHYHHHHHHQSSSANSADSLNLLNENTYHHHGHHDHHHESRGRNRTVVLPRYSDYGLYDLAMCRVQPNSATPEDQRQNIFGTITFWQKKSGGPLNIHVRVQGFEMGDHHAHHQQSVQQDEENETPQVTSHQHGFHIHSFGDLSNGCQSTGPHYNPKGVNHGGQDALVRHVGDLGNIECDEHGNTNIVFSDDIATMKGQYSILGKSVVIHEKADDLGLGGDAESLKTGNAGARLACCVIQKIDKIPVRHYKIMKTATQFRKP